MRDKVMHIYGLVSLWELAMEINEDENGFYCWLKSSCVLGCLERTKASKDQARVKGKRWLGCWWTTFVEIICTCIEYYHTNQPMGRHIVMRIKSFLDYMKKWLDVIKRTHMVENGLSHMLKVVLIKKNEIKIVASLVKKWHMKSHASSKYWNRFCLWSRV